MVGMPRVRLVLIVAALFTLIVVPMASARTVFPSVPLSEGSWLGATLRWAEDLVGLRQPARPHGQPKAPLSQKDGTTSSAQGGGCVDPFGHPRPLCL
jgi:hypothetical protein